MEIIAEVVKETINQIGLENINPKPIPEKTAYQKTEALLYNYNGFKRLLAEKERKIQELRQFGIPRKSSSIANFSSGGGNNKGLTLESELVEDAVQAIQESMRSIRRAIQLIDDCMQPLERDPYYYIIQRKYFDGETQEDIASDVGTTGYNISVQKVRLIKELAIRLFPDQVIDEMLN